MVKNIFYFPIYLDNFSSTLLNILIFQRYQCIAENNDKYFLSDESHQKRWLILMINPFQMDGKTFSISLGNIFSGFYSLENEIFVYLDNLFI